ncbi:hypothetical protein [Paraburkholderia sp. J63]|uniref:hypothetical protein n=1 Tax=Paraburkholderia sp. J63 TaxID=2805434 RepID=UPI002ABD380F|nr:hypothetical protein [Paraburkholderia sp. J63]
MMPSRVGLHDEIFHGERPVLAGVDADSTYCYLPAAEDHRDGDTWGVHLLDAAQQGLAEPRPMEILDGPLHTAQHAVPTLHR